MKSITKFVGAAFAATMLLPVAVMAQDTPNQGYVITASGDIVTSSSGLCWRTSDWTPARSVEQCDPTNKPVAAAAAPAPKATVVAATSPAAMAQPAKQPPQKMSFSADALFAFDQATLKPAGRAMLDDLTRQLKGTTYNVITVTEVKDYLVSKDIEANRINAQGKGETQPVTKSGECTGKKSAKVIACLQPDRRVDVEMEGAKQ
jgi:OOP family OmpA-OmpF porin